MRKRGYLDVIYDLTGVSTLPGEFAVTNQPGEYKKLRSKFLTGLEKGQLRICKGIAKSRFLSS